MRKAPTKTNPIEGNKLILFFFIGFLLIYFLSAPEGNTPYDYFTRLADALLQGKIYLEENPPWLNELIPTNEGTFFVPYPPMPAIVALPFRLLLGHTFPQQWLAHILGAGTVALSVKLSQLVNPAKHRVHIWIGLFVGASTVLWFLSSVGSSWYLGQVSAAFFLTAALVATFRNKPLFVGLLLGAAYLSRIHTILSLPLFVYLLWKNNRAFRPIFIATLTLLPFLLFNFWYNFSRFGVIWDKGYMLIPGVVDEPWYQKGIIHPSYIPRHLNVIFTALPVFQPNLPYILPSWGGLAIWLTSPALFISILAPLKKRLVQITWLAVALVSGPILMHGTNGFAQFGYRFLIDLLPLLVLLILITFKRVNLKWYFWVLLAAGIIVNLWGILWINKMGWVVV